MNWDQRFGSAAILRQIYDLYGFFSDYGQGVHSLDITAAAAQPGSAHKDFSDWTGKIGAEWHPDTGLTAYASVAKGYKPGGFNLGSISPVPVVSSETLIDYEGGVKKTWGRKFVVDAAIYYYDYSNPQIPIAAGTTVTNPVTGVSGVIYGCTLANAKSAHSFGIELESVWSFLENLHFTFVYSYLDSQFADFTSPKAGGLIRDPADSVNCANLKGNTIPQAPKNKITIVPQYTTHLPGGDLSLLAIYSWVDDQCSAIFDTSRYLGRSHSNLDLRGRFKKGGEARWP